MGKNKAKVNNQKKEEVLITEEERNSNPILNAVYKRIRNLNKKLAHIDELKALDQATLKPQQINKISSRGEVENEIKKNADFVAFYKGILDEIGATVQVQDNSQDLIKIATLIAVGQNIDRFMNFGQDKNLHETHHTSYKTISNIQHNRQLVDRIADIFGALTQFLKNPAQYRALQDYISYIPQAAQTPAQKKSEKIQEVRNVQQPPLKQETKQVIKTQPPKQVLEKQELSVKQEKAVEKPVEVPKPVQQIKKQEKPVQKQKVGEVKKQNNPQDSWDIQQKVKNQQPQQEKRKTRGYQNRGYNGHRKQDNNEPRNYEQENSGYRARGYNKQSRGPRGENIYKGYDRDGLRNNDKNKQYESKGNRQTSRKDSDTSLEPTPEKNKVQRPKYIQKN